MTKLAVFDCDGTLVDSQRRIVAAAEEAWISVGRAPPSAEKVRRIVGLALPTAMAALAPDAEERELALIVDGFRKAFHRLQQDPAYDEPLYPGVEAALIELRDEGVLLGIATGKGRRGLGHTLETHGIADYFVVLKTADDGPSKPDPTILKDAMTELGAEPATTAMIGDTAFDMAMAKAAGAHALGVSWGYHPRDELLAHGAQRVIDHYRQAPGAALQMLGGAS